MLRPRHSAAAASEAAGAAAAASLTWKLVERHLVAINLNQRGRLVGHPGTLAHRVKWTGIEYILLLAAEQRGRSSSGRWAARQGTCRVPWQTQ